MSGERILSFLRQMETAAQQACDFTAGMTREAFLADLRTQMAVTMALVLIGEAVAKLNAVKASFLQEHPEIPWAKIKGMRNLIAHDYYELELPVIWQTTQVDLPLLITQLATLRNPRAEGE